VAHQRGALVQHTFESRLCIMPSHTHFATLCMMPFHTQRCCTNALYHALSHSFTLGSTHTPSEREQDFLTQCGVEKQTHGAGEQGEGQLEEDAALMSRLMSLLFRSRPLPLYSRLLFPVCLRYGAVAVLEVWWCRCEWAILFSVV